MLCCVAVQLSCMHTVGYDDGIRTARYKDDTQTLVRRNEIGRCMRTSASASSSSSSSSSLSFFVFASRVCSRIGRRKRARGYNWNCRFLFSHASPSLTVGGWLVGLVSQVLTLCGVSSGAVLVAYAGASQVTVCTYR